MQVKLQPKLSSLVLILAFGICIFCSVYFSFVKNTQSDPRGSLLLSQTIAQQGTVKLDRHSDIAQEFGHQLHKKNAHIYYYFPIGSAIYSVPFVAAANLIGQDMRVRYDENRFQMVMAGFLGVATFLLLYLIAQLLTGDALRSVLMAALFWFGSGYSSTSGTALWSHGWASVLSLLAIGLTLRAYQLRAAPHIVLIGIFLFSAYLCRPTLALLSPALVIVLFTVNRVAAVKVAGIVFVLLALFILWSIYEFGQLLPDYYLPKRLGGASYSDALVGHLFSPSRGLFVFMPYLLVPLLFWRRSILVFKQHAGLTALFCWPVFHLISVSNFPHWWGGHSYGPRLMIDIIPALFVFYCLFISGLRLKSPAVLGLVPLGLLAVFINWYQGMFNVYTYQWNVQPMIDQNPEYIWDWHYPQFLHNAARHNQRERRLLPNTLQPNTAGKALDFNDKSLGFVGWHAPWPALRLSRGDASEIYFQLNDAQSYRGQLVLRIGFMGEKQVSVFLNGNNIGLLEGDEMAPKNFTISFAPDLLKPYHLNVIRFQYNAVSSAARGQHFDVAIALESLVLE